MSANPFQDVSFLRSCAKLEQLPEPDRPECAFAGRSNAGKSSALNRLCQRRSLARTSKTPGRTQLLNFFELRNGYLVDLPGYGYANVPPAVRRQWGELVGGYVNQRLNLVGIVLVMDIRHPLTPHDTQLLDWAAMADRRVHILLTKADKMSGGKGRGVLLGVQRDVGDLATCQLFSAQSGVGVEEARSALGQWFPTEKSV